MAHLCACPLAVEKGFIPGWGGGVSTMARSLRAPEAQSSGRYDSVPTMRSRDYHPRYPEPRGSAHPAED